MSNDLVKICFNLDPDDWHRTPAEWIWAKPVLDAAASAFELDNTPFHAYDVSWRDVVRAVEVEGALAFAGVIARGGHSTYRIFSERDDEVFRAWWDKLKALGCTREWGEFHGGVLYAIDVPPETELEAVYTILREGEEAKVWRFDEGHVGHPLPGADDTRPPH